MISTAGSMTSTEINLDGLAKCAHQQGSRHRLNCVFILAKMVLILG